MELRYEVRYFQAFSNLPTLKSDLYVNDPLTGWKHQQEDTDILNWASICHKIQNKFRISTFEIYCLISQAKYKS